MPRRSRHVCDHANCIKCANRKRRVEGFHTDYLIYKYLQGLTHEREKEKSKEDFFFISILKSIDNERREFQNTSDSYVSEIEEKKREIKEIKQRFTAKTAMLKTKNNHDVIAFLNERIEIQQEKLFRQDITIENLKKEIDSLNDSD